MRIALFVTCLVDSMRPQVGFAAIKLLENAGYQVEVPENQTCCGQPAYNNGDKHNAVTLARQAIRALQGYDYVVIPSGSCAGTMIKHYPVLLAEDQHWHEQAQELASRSYELTRFLFEVAGYQPTASCPHTITYHDSCSSLRELGIHQQPRTLLGQLEGLQLNELQENEVCCGFGGTFCVKYPEVSERMVSDKVANIHTSGAEIVTAADLGCLLNIAGKLKRDKSKVKAYHVAEVLAGMTDQPAIGEEN